MICEVLVCHRDGDIQTRIVPVNNGTGGKPDCSSGSKVVRNLTIAQFPSIVVLANCMSSTNNFITFLIR